MVRVNAGETTWGSVQANPQGKSEDMVSSPVAVAVASASLAHTEARAEGGERPVRRARQLEPREHSGERKAGATPPSLRRHAPRRGDGGRAMIEQRRRHVHVGGRRSVRGAARIVAAAAALFSLATVRLHVAVMKADDGLELKISLADLRSPARK